MPQVIDPFFGSPEPEYKKIDNPNDPDDKSLCIVVQDGSPFDGAVVRYTKFKLSNEVNEDDSVDCQYEYEFEVPPETENEISDDAGILFERKLGAWVLDMLQTKLEQDATKSRKSDSKESIT